MTIEVDFPGHGIGKLLVPVVVRPDAARRMPENMRRLQQRLEAGTWVAAAAHDARQS